MGGDVGVEGGLDVGELFESTENDGGDGEGCELVYVVWSSSLPPSEGGGERSRFLEEFVERRRKRGVLEVGVLKGREGSVRVEVGGAWEKKLVERGLSGLNGDERRMVEVVVEEEEGSWWVRSKGRRGF